MRFTEKAKAKARYSWEGSFSHLFITELQSGTLDPFVFRYYLIQDHYYLNHFSKLYQMIGATAENQELRCLFKENAQNLAEGEQAIRETFFAELGITDKELNATPIAPTTYHYVSHLYRQLQIGTKNSAAASMLPCAWLYQELGQKLSQKGSPQPLYQRWIDTYSGSEAARQIEKERRLLDQLYEQSSPQEQEKMIESFVISCEMEYAFWEMAYQKEAWQSVRQR